MQDYFYLEEIKKKEPKYILFYNFLKIISIIYPMILKIVLMSFILNQKKLDFMKVETPLILLKKNIMLIFLYLIIKNYQVALKRINFY